MLLGLSQPRYSGYETGRAEPPIEILVRLSYLYDVPMNTMLTQRDRLYRTNEDVQRQINQLKQQIEEIEAKLVENGGENATTAAALEVMKNLLQEMQKANANPSIAQQLRKHLGQIKIPLEQVQEDQPQGVVAQPENDKGGKKVPSK